MEEYDIELEDECGECETEFDGELKEYIDEYAPLIKKCQELACKIIRMNSGEERDRYLNDYYAVISYLKAMGLVPVCDETEYISTNLEELYNLKMLYNQYKQIEEFYNNIDLVSKINNNLIDEYEKNNYFDEYRSSYKINSKKYYQALAQFFKYLGDDVYNLYCKLVEEKHISYLSYLKCFGTGGLTYPARQEDSYIQIDNDPNSFEEINFICHEMGHAYQTYLLKSQDNKALDSLYVEFFSQLFEKMFFRYLRQNDLFNDSVEKFRLDRYSILYRQTKDCKKLADLIQNKDVTVENILYKEYSDNVIAKIEDEGDREKFENGEIDWVDQIYVLDSSIGEYFLRLMEKDFQKGFKAAKDFILTAHNYTLKENLEKYLGDLTPTYENMMEAIESVRVKKYIKK